jgi:methylglutaconyl-CoA hydratase
MSETIELEIDGQVATISLNRPSVRNAFNAEMIAELTETFLGLRTRDDIRVVVLRGNGPTFSAGADITWMRSSLDFTEEQNGADALHMSDMFAAIDEAPQVVIGSVHGAALGGGMGLLAVCDIAVAAEGTKFGFTEAKLGIIPAVISRFVLGRIGAHWARALYLTAERFGPDVARQIGLVHWIVATDELDDCIRAKVREVLTSGPEATRVAKRLIAEASAMPPRELRDYTARAIARVRTSPEGQEGLRAFLEKRRPSWQVEDAD